MDNLAPMTALSTLPKTPFHIPPISTFCVAEATSFSVLHTWNQHQPEISKMATGCVHTMTFRSLHHCNKITTWGPPILICTCHHETSDQAPPQTPSPLPIHPRLQPLCLLIELCLEGHSQSLSLAYRNLVLKCALPLCL